MHYRRQEFWQFILNCVIRTSALCKCETKGFAVDQCLCFRYKDSTIPASNHLLWLYSPACVGPGRRPRRQVFSRRGSFYNSVDNFTIHTKAFLCVCQDFPIIDCVHILHVGAYNDFNVSRANKTELFHGNIYHVKLCFFTLRTREELALDYLHN